MSYLRCTHADCLQIHAPAPDTTFGQLLERAEQACDECGRAPLAIFAGNPPGTPAGRFSNASTEERA